MERLHTLAQDGFEVRRGVMNDPQLEALRKEADSVAEMAGSPCVRHLRNRSRIFEELGVSRTILELLPERMIPVRSILFDKTPGENWPVAWHQDLTITVVAEHEVTGYGPWSRKDGVPHVQAPVSLLQNMVTVRLHLDDTPATNGALHVVPGSHRHGRLSPSALANFDSTDAVICECRPGDVLLMSPLILHSSLRSQQPARRRVIHFEYARDHDLDSRLDWFERHSTCKAQRVGTSRQLP